VTVTLTTTRLILRQPDERDFAPSCVFWASERSHMMGGPWTEAQTRTEYEDVMRQWRELGFSLFAVTVKGSEDCIGLIGPFYPVTHPEPELGWSLWDVTLEGKGIAFEAAQAARDWFFTATRYRTAISFTDPQNFRSHRLCERLGAVVDPSIDHDDEGPVLTYRHHARAA